MESKLDSWNDPYGCRDVSLAEDVISELQDTIVSQERDIAELVDFVLMFRKDRLNNPSGIISSSTDNTAGKLTTKHKGAES